MRTRDLKPDFWTDERVVQVTDSAKLLFQGLWALSDREGRLEDKPVAIGFKVRPWDPAPAGIVSMLDELEHVGLIVRYEAEGIKCIWIPGLPTHQRLHPREMQSNLPAPPLNSTAGREKASLGKPRHAIAPGSSGPSGSAKPAGPSGSSGPSNSPLPPSTRGGTNSKPPRRTKRTGHDPNDGIMRNTPAPPTWPTDTPAGAAFVTRLDQLHDQGDHIAANQLMKLEPALEGEQLVLQTPDPYFAEYAREHYLGALNGTGPPVELRCQPPPENPP